MQEPFVGLPLLSLSFDHHPLTIDCMLPLMDLIGAREGARRQETGSARLLSKVVTCTSFAERCP
jgi:hypothetical protein